MTRISSATQISKGFGERLKTARKHLNLTQEELASKTGLSVVTLSKLESGTNKPSFDVVATLCHSMDIEPNYFFGWSGDFNSEGNTDRRRRLNDLLLNLQSTDDEWIDIIRSIIRKSIR